MVFEFKCEKCGMIICSNDRELNKKNKCDKCGAPDLRRIYDVQISIPRGWGD